MKTAKRKPVGKKEASARPKSWRDAVRKYLSKVPKVDAVFVNDVSGIAHVYSVVEKFGTEDCGLLLKQEAKVEKAFPQVPFEFHTRAHQGRKPGESGPWGAELVYLR